MAKVLSGSCNARTLVEQKKPSQQQLQNDGSLSVASRSRRRRKSPATPKFCFACAFGCIANAFCGNRTAEAESPAFHLWRRGFFHAFSDGCGAALPEAEAAEPFSHASEQGKDCESKGRSRNGRREGLRRSKGCGKMVGRRLKLVKAAPEKPCRSACRMWEPPAEASLEAFGGTVLQDVMEKPCLQEKPSLTPSAEPPAEPFCRMPSTAAGSDEAWLLLLASACRRDVLRRQRSQPCAVSGCLPDRHGRRRQKALPHSRQGFPFRRLRERFVEKRR